MFLLRNRLLTSAFPLVTRVVRLSPDPRGEAVSRLAFSPSPSLRLTWVAQGCRKNLRCRWAYFPLHHPSVGTSAAWQPHKGFCSVFSWMEVLPETVSSCLTPPLPAPSPPTLLGEQKPPDVYCPIFPNFSLPPFILLPPSGYHAVRVAPSTVPGT